MWDAALEALEAARESGQAEKVWADRCPKGCLLAGAWNVRGRTVYAVTRFKLSPAKQAEHGLPRHVEGRAWLDTPPSGPVWTGCQHQLRRVTLRTS